MQVFLIPHFHYDPVWIKTQYDYTERLENSAFNLIKQYLKISKEDPDYTFVLEQIPYLKPYWDTFPEDRKILKKLMKEKRLEIAGGMYNEPQTTLTSAETTIRNIAYGKLYNRYILNFESITSWMLDVFGHDINFPQFLKKAQIKFCTFSRGPYKRGWGIPPQEIFFKTEFWWVSPDGSKILTHLMEPGHYGYGYGKLKKEEYNFEKIKNLMEELSDYAEKFSLVPYLLFPLGGDMATPIVWLGRFVREFKNKRKFFLSIPEKYFEKVKREKVFIPPLSIDFNPVNNGCDVSYIDLKIINRKIENLLLSSEKFSTISYLLGGEYPYFEIDRAWRQILFSSHHDALTGSCSDQVYVDLLGIYREAYEMAKNSLEKSLNYLTNLIKTENSSSYIVFNPLSWERDDVVEIEGENFQVFDEEKNPVACCWVDGKTIFIAENMPSFGYKTYFLKKEKKKDFSLKRTQDLFIENEYFKIKIDRTGAIVSIFDRENKKEIVKNGGIANELVAHLEYPEHPHWKEGPWNLSFTGEKIYSSEYPGTVKVEKGEILERIVVEGEFYKCRRKSEIRLYKKIKRIDFSVDISEYTGENICYKVHFPLNLKNVVPVYEVSNSVVTRTFCCGDKDTKKEPSTQDNACYNFIDLSSSLLIEFLDEKNKLQASYPISIGEIIYGENPPEKEIFELLSCFIQKGVSSAVTKDNFRRYGDIKWDSNTVNLRISIGGPEKNSFTKFVLKKIKKSPESDILFLENLKLGLPQDSSVILIMNNEREILRKFTEMIKKSGKIVLPYKFYNGKKEKVENYGVALINQGTVSGCVYKDKTLTMSLFRSSTGYPAGVWIDTPERKLFDNSCFQVMHWSKKFYYSLYPHRGDFREAKVYKVGYEVNNPLIVKKAIKNNCGRLPSSFSFLKIKEQNLLLTALKLKGYPFITNKFSNLITMRLYEAEGKKTEFNFSFFKKLLEIKESDILEEKTFKPDFTFKPAETKTFILKPDFKNKNRKLQQKGKFYSKYWRYNSGCAPLGFQPVSINFLDENRIKVANCGISPVRGEISLELPSGWKLKNKKLKYNLKKDEFKIFFLKIAKKISPEKIYKIKAKTKDIFGFEYFDIYWIGERKEIFQESVKKEIKIKRGTTEKIYLELKNLSDVFLEGEAFLIVPYSLWEMNFPYNRNFKIPPYGNVKLEYFLKIPAYKEAATYWGIFKIMCEGILKYSEVFKIEICD